MANDHALTWTPGPIAGVDHDHLRDVDLVDDHESSMSECRWVHSTHSLSVICERDLIRRMRRKVYRTHAVLIGVNGPRSLTIGRTHLIRAKGLKIAKRTRANQSPWRVARHTSNRCRCADRMHYRRTMHDWIVLTEQLKLDK